MLKFSEWEMQVPDVVLQENGYDCGIYTMAYGKSLIAPPS
jgi:Ulp1 family protease